MADESNRLIHLRFTEASTADLRGKQSVRTTFKLTEEAIEALSILAGQLGIKQKSLFDHLIEDIGALQLIAEEFDEFARGSRRVAKTYVISRKTLDSLERVSNQYNTPRDALVEHSIARIMPLLQREKEKHEVRKDLLSDLQRFWSAGVAMLEAAESELGSDDPATRALQGMMRGVTGCCQTVEVCVEKGRKLEEL